MRFISSLLLVGFFLAADVRAADLEGVWELVSGEYRNEHGEMIAYDTIGLESLKILSGTHFSFTSMKADKFWASGTGTYSFVDGEYVEQLKFNSFGEKPGARFAFTAELDGSYWRNARWDGDVRVEYEVWRRVE
ncbi:hypothetical protein [Microbulbifer hydrolyticus]|uniref:Lipocalin-like domain-containing protein n=1 Tax=Microbulbifer hydrolyticus TaxID=48074 RepID=A0A6P1THZ8_9GAMM|nr:hypothetical protein [Microbulbifer hydrolyticus]MBB5213097.1 hypothetical protein [Microbulbifer hydrolyticus]QHQ40452.1 hypothetical protein GTQ55_16700 [Microbulbifer hydrolyticus]